MSSISKNTKQYLNAFLWLAIAVSVALVIHLISNAIPQQNITIGSVVQVTITSPFFETYTTVTQSPRTAVGVYRIIIGLSTSMNVWGDGPSGSCYGYDSAYYNIIFCNGVLQEIRLCKYCLDNNMITYLRIQTPFNELIDINLASYSTIVYDSKIGGQAYVYYLPITLQQSFTEIRVITPSGERIPKSASQTTVTTTVLVTTTSVATYTTMFVTYQLGSNSVSISNRAFLELIALGSLVTIMLSAIVKILKMRI